MSRTSPKVSAVLCVALALLLWRAVPAVRFELWPRLGEKRLTELRLSTELSASERDRRTFGAYTEAWQLLDRSMPDDGILSLVGFDPRFDAQVAFVRALRTSLDGRLVRTTEELADYLLVRHRERFDARVFVLRFLPSDAIDPNWAPLLEPLAIRPRFEIHRVKGPIR